jgi:hypothetical protein
VSPDPAFQPVTHRADLEIDGLDAAEGALHPGQGFVAAHGGRVVHDLEAEAGAHDIDAIRGGLGFDRVGFAREGEARIGDGQIEMFAHFMLVDHAADGQRDVRGATQRLALARGGQSDTREIAFGGRQQFLALAGALGGKIAIAANDQTLGYQFGPKVLLLKSAAGD